MSIYAGYKVKTLIEAGLEWCKEELLTAFLNQNYIYWRVDGVIPGDNQTIDCLSFLFRFLHELCISASTPALHACVCTHVCAHLHVHEECCGYLFFSWFSTHYTPSLLVFFLLFLSFFSSFSCSYFDIQFSI